jgi:hypothetical protein
MLTAAIDIIGGVWLIKYAVPTIFDAHTGAIVDVAIVVLAVMHIWRRLTY